ncbi:sensor domain-containing diguanylate cyclase, partial [Belnapia moabensis]|uniref:sensor domain-containing diguanylate cyclase n=1 Tax=Belnapia moabensis TaxID=365533 RepID=UPI0012EDF31C
MAPFHSAAARKVTLYWRLLLLASIAVPGLVTAAAAWQNHKHLMTAARDTLERTTALAREHALKVTETNLLVLDRIEDRVHGLAWEAILRRQETLHRDLRSIDEQIEQIAALHLVTPNGLIAAVSTVFPAPAVPITDRSYFKRHAAGEAGPLFGDPIVSRISGKLAFTMTRRRAGPNGEFDGIVFGSFLPEYFQRHWETLVAGRSIYLTLLRADGQSLAQFSPASTIETASPVNGELVQAINSADSGLLKMGLRSDGTERLVAFSRIGQHPLYIVSALSLSAIWAEWWSDLGVIVAFGTLTSVCLIFLTLQAGRRWRAAQEAVLLHSATHDALTGLPNRRRLQERLSEMLAGSTRGKHPIALLMIDLDRFKP